MHGLHFWGPLQKTSSLVTQVVIREREKAWRIRFLSKFPLVFLSKFQGFQGRHLPLIGTAWLRHCPQVCIRACNFCMHGHHQCTILHMVLSLRCAVSCTLSPSRCVSLIFAGIYGFRIGFSNLFLTEIILAFKFRPQILLFYFIFFWFFVFNVFSILIIGINFIFPRIMKFLQDFYDLLPMIISKMEFIEIIYANKLGIVVAQHL